MAGETGSGKTTQCPNFILEAGSAVLEEGFMVQVRLWIVCPQKLFNHYVRMVLGVAAF